MIYLLPSSLLGLLFLCTSSELLAQSGAKESALVEILSEVNIEDLCQFSSGITPPPDLPGIRNNSRFTTEPSMDPHITYDKVDSSSSPKLFDEVTAVTTIPEEGSFNGSVVAVTESNVKEKLNLSVDSRKVFDVFVNASNRDQSIVSQINKQKKKLQEHSCNSYEVNLRQKLISYLEKAKEYQNKMIGHLIDSAKKGFNLIDQPAEKAKAIEVRTVLNQEQILKLNSHPNKIEQRVAQIEQDYEQLGIYRNKLALLQIELARLNQQAPNTPEMLALVQDLQVRIQCLEQAVMHQQRLIQVRCDSVQYINPPYEKVAQETEVVRNQNGKSIIVEKYSAQARNLQAEQIAAIAAGEQKKARCFRNMLNIYSKTINELRKDLPNQQVIRQLAEALDYFYQALTALDVGETSKTIYCNTTGVLLLNTIQETQKDQPNQELIKQLLEAVNYFRQALKALDVGEKDREKYCFDAGRSLMYATEEAQKNQPNQSVVDRFTEATNYFYQALTALDMGTKDREKYCVNAGCSLISATKEAQKNQPNQLVIDRLMEAVNYFRQALTALDAGEKDKEKYCFHAGCSLMHAAEEAQKDQPNQPLIDRCIELSKHFRQVLALLDIGEKDKSKSGNGL